LRDSSAAYAACKLHREHEARLWRGPPSPLVSMKGFQPSALSLRRSCPTLPISAPRLVWSNRISLPSRNQKMIKDIYCGSRVIGNSLPSSVDTLIHMGPVAVQKLSETLPHESITYKRGLIVGYLGTIGGAQARLALNRALRMETNEDVIRWIKRSLSTMPKKAH
jgi:hypothetical protein